MPEQIVLLTGREQTRRIVACAVAGTGWRLIEASNVADSLRICSNDERVAMVIDWLLPDEAGLEACRRLKQLQHFSRVPIVLLADSNSPVDKRSAVATGATAILVSPVKPRELRARLTELLHATSQSPMTLHVGDIEVDVAASSALRRGRVLLLGPSEFRLLELLARSPARVVTREQIVEHLWGAGTSVKAATINIHVVRLRKALLAVRRIDPIRTVRGVGYRLVSR